MTHETTDDRQRTETGKAAAQLASKRAAVERRGGEPPRPGDTFLFRESAETEHAVEWAILEERSGDGRLLVVPLDDHPLVGSRDVELAPEALGGVANLRGGAELEAWLDASDFELELRTGALSRMDLERVRRKRRDLLADKLTPSILEEEVDGDPQYLRWREELLAAREALPVRPEIEKAAYSKPLLGALAAAALLAAVMVGTWWTTKQVRDQLQTERDRVARLESEREELNKRLATSAEEAGRLEVANQELRELREALSQELEKQQLQLAKLKDALLGEIQINLPTIELTGRDRVRGPGGEPYRLVLPPDAKRVALSLEVVDPEPYSSYRLRIVAEDTGEEIWRTDELVKLGGRWLRLDLPATFLEPGRYNLLIYGLTDGSPTQLGERYYLKVEERLRR